MKYHQQQKIKENISKTITNASKIDSHYDEELVNNKILTEQNDLIDYYTYSLNELNKNIFTQEYQKMKNDIIELKSDIKYESKKEALSV
ncbi:hypothetical protein J4731_11890 [Providencia rettgeri]|nr:hypothetical protein [Providencia rettgeri]